VAKTTAFCGIVRKFAAKNEIFHRKRMKKYLYMLCVLLAATMSLTSCLKDDNEEVTLYNDAAITAFTLGALNQYADGKDSVIAKITGSNYKMHIKQTAAATASLPAGYHIFNTDSLPYGTRINSVLCTVTALNSGGIAVKNIDNDQFQWYSSSVGIDFANDSTTRIFRVFSTDGTYHRDYRVQLNVAKRASDNVGWYQVAQDTQLSGFSNMRMLTIDTVLVALGKKSSATEVLASKDYGKTWTKVATLDENAWANAVSNTKKAFTMSGGQLYSTTNGTTWNAESSATVTGLKKLVGLSTKELYAITKDSVMNVSSDGGLTWMADDLSTSLKTDSVKQLLGLDDIAFASFPFIASDSTDYCLLTGNNKTNTVVWRKITRYGGTPKGGKWVNIPTESINDYKLPQAQHSSLVYINDAAIAYGTSATTAYKSVDQGITWRIDTSYALPEAMMAVTKDSHNNVLWAVTANGKVWKGVK
jgi:hypothetical protein